MKLKELSLSQYIAKIVSISHWGSGILFAIFAILAFFAPTVFGSLASVSPMFSQIGETNGLASQIGGVVGILMLIPAIYSFIVAYGMGKYKNYARIMVLIPLYIFAGSIAIFGLIPSIVLLFAAPVVGLISIIIFVFYELLLFLAIYLFQKQKDMVALFKGQ